jgi:hypothetical protein
MTYTEEGDNVTLEMTRDDYARLLMIVGIATGSAFGQGTTSHAWSIIRFINELNRTNPAFTPYKIP